MPKKIDDVIVPGKKRSIRNIPIPEGRKRAPRMTTDSLEKPSFTTRVPEMREAYLPPTPPPPTPPTPPPPPRAPMMPPPREPRKGKRAWLMAFIALVVVSLAVLSFFDHATFAYTPKSSNLTFNNEVYSAAKTGENVLIYSVVKLSGDKGQSVDVSGEQEVTRPASGTIVVYNNFSAQPQQLIATTRFESPSGKVYRIRNDISVPGKKGDQPGSLEVTVYADEGGESYNSAATDFTLPGLKGTSRYTTVYARSKGPLTGGFKGREKVVSEADLSKAKTQLRTALAEELLARAQAEVPDDFILFPSLSSVTFEDLPQSASGEAGTANVNLRGHLYGIMFKRVDLARELAKTKTAILNNEIVELEAYDGLKLSFSGATPTELLPLNEIKFKVEGSGKLLWRTDEVALKADLFGRKKSEIASLLKNYPTITSADATLRPFWKTSFPAKGDKLTIKKLKAE